MLDLGCVNTRSFLESHQCGGMLSQQNPGQRMQGIAADGRLTGYMRMNGLGNGFSCLLT